MRSTGQIKICIICGRGIYDSDPKIASKPRKGKTVYAHPECIGVVAKTPFISLNEAREMSLKQLETE